MIPLAVETDALQAQHLGTKVTSVAGSTREWYVLFEGKKHGPESLERIAKLIQKGILAPNCPVWRKGLSGWTEANRLSELVALLAPSSAPSSAPQSAPPFPAGSIVPTTPPQSPSPPVPQLPPYQPLVAAAPAAIPGALTAANLEHSSRATVIASTTPAPEAALSCLIPPDAARRAMGDATWTALLNAGMNPSSIFGCFPVARLRVADEPNESTAASALSLLRRVSHKISDITDRGEMLGQHSFIDAGPDQAYVASRMVGKTEVWPVLKQSFDVCNRWQDNSLEVEFHASNPNSRIRSIVLRVPAGEEIPETFLGSVLPLLSSAAIGAARIGPRTLPALLRARVAVGQPGTFDLTYALAASVSLVEIADDALNITYFGNVEAIPLSDIIAWRASESSVSIFTSGADRVRNWVISPCGYLDPFEIAITTPAKADTRPLQGEDGPLSNPPHSPPTPEPATDPAMATPCRPATPQTLEARESLSEIVAFLEARLPESRAHRDMLVAEFEAVAIFNNQPTRVLIKNRDKELAVAEKRPHASANRWLSNFRLYCFQNHHFLQLDENDLYRIQIAGQAGKWGEALARVTAERSIFTTSLVLLSKPDMQSEPTSTTAPWKNYQPRLLSVANGVMILSDPCANAAEHETLEVGLDKLGAESRVWNAAFGVVPIQTDGDSTPRWLIADNRTLVGLWQQAELKSLTVRTTGVSLGVLYREYNNSRCEMYLTGVFGNFFLAQRQLEQESSVESLIKSINDSPPGPLPAELANQLIRRLSILEVSRHQLTRWMDRCALMYPHYMAQSERDWLANAFGERIVDRATQEKEAWRVHQQFRSELRQVQASMGKALAEVGQNLQTVSWAFPEEVRFAALAAIRRSAGMAEKGAMIAAFSGVGTQLLMGLGRASLGDPLGIAMVGAVGLSLVGKQLEKNVKEKEKQIRLRAYGVQALQWWDTTLETAAVMALECRYAMELSRQAATARDRQLLEKLTPEELSKAQQRMAAIMKRSLREDTSSQFYETMPGSGIFGWHLVDQITAIAADRSNIALTRFRGELPGAMADTQDTITNVAIQR